MAKKDGDQTISFGLLSALSDEDLNAFFDCGIRTVLTAKQHVLRQGQRNASLFVVMEGGLRILREIEGSEVVLGRLEPGSFFGEISLFDPGPATATVRSVARSVVVEIRREHLDYFVSKRPEAGATVLLALLEDMAKRFRHTDERLNDLILWGNMIRD